jgi:peptidyl-tRNA hydrolase
MTTPVLFILMRNDLTSLNAGKAMAQASHAANAFVALFRAYAEEYNSVLVHNEHETANILGFDIWENSTTQAFGTVLVLAAEMREIKSVVGICQKLGYIADVIHDPTYPIVDGKVVHYIPLDTCGYVFVPSKETDVSASAFLKEFPLHP